VTGSVDKRSRLIESAKQLFHEQGVHTTTLADVAGRAGIPLGNVYYYFKTKDELIAAVVDAQKTEIASFLALIDQKRTPQARLKALAQQWVDSADIAAQYGCPIGSLCSELMKGPSFNSGPDAPFAIIVDWAQQQLRELGVRDSRDQAMSIVGRIQGASLLAQSFRDPKILAREARLIDRWVDSLP
jgi:AcrR family transcriptional regulator